MQTKTVKCGCGHSAPDYSRPMRLLPFFLLALAVQAGPWEFFTVGGGYSEDSNQVSLEKNVIFLQRLLTAMGHNKAPHHLLFSDGNAGGRDLHFLPAQAQVPHINDTLSLVLGYGDTLSYSYRSHEFKTNGAASVANVEAWFADANFANDRLLFYFTGHGGEGTKKRPGNTCMHLWNDEDLRVAKFAKLLDGLPPDKEVVVVMVQCYSGGFANILFKEGNPDKGLAEQVRAGFFATVPTHYAAGCTPEIDEESYQDYSSSFFAALWGQDRTGKPVKKPDYDGDGHVSFAEAHAYTIIHSRTIDAPVKTSDLFLRTYSKLAPLDDLLSHADSAERAILTALSEQLEGAPLTAAAARKQADAFAKERDDIHDRMEAIYDRQDSFLEVVARDITAQWPELANPFHPKVAELLQEPQSTAIIKAVESHPDYARYAKSDRALNRLNKRYTHIDEIWPLLERYARTAENVILRHHLPKVADSAILQRFAQLQALEARGL